MNKITINHFVKKEEVILGSLKVTNIIFDAKAIEDYLYKYVLTKENLEYIFCDSSINSKRYSKMLKRFVPSFEFNDASLSKYIDDISSKNKSFYSFFAEALLPLVYRDVYNYDLKSAAIDINQTLIDTNSGADSCLYDKSNNAFVLGEAKFYQSFDAGLTKIIKNFIKDKSIINKLDSLSRTLGNNDESNSIIIKSLNKKELDEYSLKEFLSLNLIFSGFVLHEASSIDLSKINNDDFYEAYGITVDDVKNNIDKNINFLPQSTYKVVMFHFFVESKKNLIFKCIKHARDLMEGIK